MAKDSPTQHPFTKVLWSVTYICGEKKSEKIMLPFYSCKIFQCLIKSNHDQESVFYWLQGYHKRTNMPWQAVDSNTADSKLPHKQNNQSPIWSGERGWEARYSMRDRYDSRSKGQLRYTRSCDTSHSFSKDPTLHHLSMGTQLFTLFCKSRVHSLDA